MKLELETKNIREKISYFLNSLKPSFLLFFPNKLRFVCRRLEYSITRAQTKC